MTEYIAKIKENRFIKMIKKPSKTMFWSWIAYQTIKGTITTCFIWAPLLYTWMHHS
jgi:hypothetical protein